MNRFFEWIVNTLLYDPDDDEDDIDFSLGLLEGEDATLITKSLEQSRLRRDLNVHNPFERDQYIRHLCELMSGASDDVDIKRTDYTKITDRLQDIEEIEGLPKPEFNEIRRRARAIIDFEAKEARYKRPESKIPADRFREIESMKDDMPDIIKRLKENEDYQTLVKRDMNLLEGEKAGLAYDRKENRKKASNAKAGFVICFIIAALAYLIIFLLCSSLYYNYKLPLMAVTAVLAICLTVVFVKFTEARDNISKLNRQINRAISLQNTAKIKYINVTNAIDYVYNKYNIHASHELIYFWEKYQEEIEARNHSENAAFQLEQLRNELYNAISRFHIKDPGFFVYSPEVLVYDDEMSKLRHSLVIERQKLRKGIDFEVYNLDAYKKEIEDLVKQFPQYSKDILKVVEEYE